MRQAAHREEHQLPAATGLPRAHGSATGFVDCHVAKRVEGKPYVITRMRNHDRRETLG
jgi:hypothetical protein